MPAKAGPVETLAHKLRSYLPPSLSALVAIIQDHEHYAEFVELVREILPEKERDILGESTPSKQISLFAKEFERRYFPLSESLQYENEQSYYDILCNIPLIPLGIGYEDYDRLVQDGNDGIMLMTVFFEQPYGDDGARIALVEGCRDYVSPELMQKIPVKGYSIDEMHHLLDATPYSDLAVWGDILFCNTDNFFLDTDDEMYYNSLPPDWSRENIEWLTRAWREAQEKQEAVFEMAGKFEHKPKEFFQEVIEFIAKRQESKDGAKADTAD
jgi:hypothetical protein